MEIYLAGLSSRQKIVEKVLEEGIKIPYILESFIYFKPFQIPLIKNSKFMLDSGAFTFINGKKNKSISIKDIRELTKKYIDFINKHGIKLFIEMDLDKVIGLKEVEKLRKLIEEETNKKTIPVFHPERGKDYFINMIKEYDYVALGGIGAKSKSKEYVKYFPWFIEEAKKNNCKIHGLGFTALSKLNKPNYQFNSVDSTTWVHGHRFSYLDEFNGKYLERTMLDTKLRKDLKKICEKNLIEWIKFSKYMGRF